MMQSSILKNTKGQNLILFQEKFQSCWLEEEYLSWMVMKYEKRWFINNVDEYSDGELAFPSDGTSSGRLL